MKITRAELKSIINEVLSEVVDDKYTKALDALAKKREVLNINSARIGVDIAKVKLSQALDKERVASDTLETAKTGGGDTSSEEEALENAKKGVQKARDGVTASNNALKTAQKGGAPSVN